MNMSVTGEFSWTPSQPGKYSVTVRVKDSGIPILAYDSTFSIDVSVGLFPPSLRLRVL